MIYTFTFCEIRSRIVATDAYNCCSEMELEKMQDLSGLSEFMSLLSLKLKDCSLNWYLCELYLFGEMFDINITVARQVMLQTE